ncbi:MAG: spore coat associated protein CotJA [Anaerotignum sp.]|nr:spore coat associated protein CotJA [Anaerotignum sp.]MBR2851589.1 spore coat associated protein CotJA [Anaerotignum sp.]MBR3993265.1 spore coat associated protein CotJA [Anaerotignum sp.]
MKEMCRNFICNTNKCPSASGAQAAALVPDTSMGDCSSCVMERIGLAQAFVPSQPYTAPMEQERSLVCGTTFSELVMPYCSGWNLYRFAKEA